MGRHRQSTEHGTYSMYNSGKCRCDLCRIAAAEKRAKYRPVVGEQPKNYSVTYGSARVRVPGQPLVDWMERNIEVDIPMRKKMRKWLANGLDVYYADKLAIRFGTHPALIWGREFYQGCPGYEAL